MDEARSPRVLQIFLDDAVGVCEVYSIDCDCGSVHRVLECTCPLFDGKICRHVALVYRILQRTKSGAYIARISRDIPAADLEEGQKDWRKMRRILAEYADIFTIGPGGNA